MWTSCGPAQFIRALNSEDDSGANKSVGKGGHRLLLVSYPVLSKGWTLSADDAAAGIDHSRSADGQQDPLAEDEEDNDDDYGEEEGEKESENVESSGGASRNVISKKKSDVVRYSVVLLPEASIEQPAVERSDEKEKEKRKKGCDEGQTRPLLLQGAVLDRLLCAFCKQLVEKLDSVRQAAGEGLVRILAALSPQKHPLATLLSRILLETIQDFSQNQPSQKEGPGNLSSKSSGLVRITLNWSQPDHVFSFATKALAASLPTDGFSPPRENLFYSLLSGLVISIGGLTESTAKEALRALLQQWQRARDLSNSTGELFTRHIGLTLLDLLRSSSKDDRVILPAMKTVDKLLRSSFFQEDLADQIGAQLKKEIVACRSVGKLLAYADILSLLLSFRGKVRRDAFADMMTLLGHKYPTVRKCKPVIFFISKVSVVI